jgi:hypothetical protein
MKNRAGEYSGYNETDFKLGRFYGVASGEQQKQPFWERAKQFAGWVVGATLTAPSEAPVHMREHFPNHQSDQNIAA